MRSLSEIISQNARLALDRAIKAAKEEGETLTKEDVVRKMQRRMVRVREIKRNGSKEIVRETWSVDTIRRTVNKMLEADGTRPWEADYLEAFCFSIGAPPERIVSPDYDGSKLSHAEHAEYLARALGNRLEPEDTRRIVENLNRELDHPGLYELVTDVAETLIAADSQEQADYMVSELIRASDLWGAKSSVRKRKMVRDKYS